MSVRIGRTLCLTLFAAAAPSMAAAQDLSDVLAAYRALAADSVATLCPDPGAPGVPLDVALIALRARARAGDPETTRAAVRPLMERHPDNSAVHMTAAVIHHAAGDLVAARAALDRSFALPEPEAEAWLVDATLRIAEGDAAGAAAAYHRALLVEPGIGASWLGYRVGEMVGQARGDAGILAGAAERMADAAEARGRTRSAERYRTESAMYSAVSGPLFAVSTARDSVSLPLVPCHDRSPYSCVVLHADGDDYRILLDTGNAVGLTVHDPALRDALTSVRGPEGSVTTGSVDTALTTHQLLAERIDFGDFTISNVVGQFFPKPREPYFDGNLNPFMLRDRVITVDYAAERLIIRTLARAREAFEAMPRDRIASLPAGGFEWVYVPVTLNGLPGTAMIETGAEDLHVSGEWAAANGVALADTVIIWREREFPMKVTTATVKLGPLTMGPRSAPAGPVGARDPITGMPYSVMIGPAALREFAISFDPDARRVVLVGP